MEKGAGEKRKFDRVHFVIDLALDAGGKPRRYDRTLDISMGGIFVVGDEPLDVGTEGKFTISLSPGEEGIKIKGKFKVAGVSEKEGKKGMGVNFTEIDSDSSMELYKVVQYNKTVE